MLGGLGLGAVLSIDSDHLYLISNHKSKKVPSPILIPNMGPLKIFFDNLHDMLGLDDQGL